MAIIKKYWKTLYFSKSHKPKIVCPTCNEGHLQIWSDSYKSRKSAKTQKDEDKPNFHIFEAVSVSAGIFHCDNRTCGEYVACCGELIMDAESDDDGYTRHIPTFVPLYFHPPLSIIQNTSVYPNNIQKSLKDSFSLFFADLESCANKIRIVLEILLNNERVNRTAIVKHKRVWLSLHRRILLYESTNPEIARKLLAIKWIGNAGSHSGSIRKDDILDAYIILENVLNSIYSESEKDIAKTVRLIIKSKGPISKK